MTIAAATRAAAARADAEEASLSLDLGPAALRIEDPQDQGATDTVPGLRLVVRGTYAPGDYKGLGDYWALEVGAGFVMGNGATYPDQDVPGVGVRSIIQDERALRLTAGVTARLGVRFIPTVTALVGYQHRFLTNVTLQDPQTGFATGTLPDGAANDLLAGLGVGLEYRHDSHWIFGVSVQLLHGFSLDGNAFDAVEVPVTAAYYWYPRF